MTAPSLPFSTEELHRYGRQMLLLEISGRGQKRLRSASVVLQADGLLGQVCAEYLVRAGVPLLVREASEAGERGRCVVTFEDPLHGPPLSAHGAGDDPISDWLAGAELALLVIKRIAGIS